jgi:NADPH:quinone reductase-like Zn-dependent oxidoreductase
VQHYGAKKVIVTGRNQQSLNELLTLGAEELIAVGQHDDSFKEQLKTIHAQTPIDVIIDYLWGHTAEMILSCIQGNGSFSNKIRYVSVGSVTGDVIQLSAATLRSIDLQLTGSGLGAWTKQQVRQFFKEILPDMYQLATKGKIRIETVTVKLADIAELWDLDIPGGKRLVVTI